MIATTIIAVLVSVSVIGFALWWAGRKAELAQRDPILLRRVLVSVATLYIVSGLFFIVEVAIGKAPLQTLGGLPISVTFGGYCEGQAKFAQTPE